MREERGHRGERVERVGELLRENEAITPSIDEDGGGRVWCGEDAAIRGDHTSMTLLFVDDVVFVDPCAAVEWPEFGHTENGAELTE